MAAPSAMTLFQAFKADLGNGTHDLDTNAYVCCLMPSSWTPNAATQAVWADISASELATANGYTQGGVSLGACTYNQTAGTAAFKSAANPAWTGSGAGFAARYYVIRANGTYNTKVNPLIGYGLLDSAPADVTFAPGNQITLTMNAAGWLTNT